VLGLVGRDLLFDLVEAVVAEDGPRAFALADRAVESGHDLRLVLRELSRAVRDMMIVSVDPSRAGDGELAEGERERLTQLASRFSREDLMRAFDLLANAEQEIRTVSHPRYHFEMVLLKWMHVRRLVPLVDLLTAGGGTPATTVKPQLPIPKPPISTKAVPAPKEKEKEKQKEAAAPAGNLKDKLLAEIRSGKAPFYNTVVAQAQRIEVANEKITFVFAPTQSALRGWFDQQQQWLEAAAERVAGKKVAVVSELGAAAATANVSPSNPTEPGSRMPDPALSDKRRDLKAEAMSSTTVQAMLDVFPAEIRDVEEM
jgi:DNA polymerase III gamma/tau subunit